jgi:hypothetical protein
MGSGNRRAFTIRRNVLRCLMVVSRSTSGVVSNRSIGFTAGHPDIAGLGRSDSERLMSMSAPCVGAFTLPVGATRAQAREFGLELQLRVVGMQVICGKKHQPTIRPTVMVIRKLGLAPLILLGHI